MVTDLFGDIPILLLEVNIFESFSLNVVSLEKNTFPSQLTYKHGIERFSDPAERRRIV